MDSLRVKKNSDHHQYKKFIEYFIIWDDSNVQPNWEPVENLD